jgi:hypothetical protein
VGVRLSSLKSESNNMAKGKVTINVTNTQYAYIDGKTGEEITREQFIQKTRGLNVGGYRTNVLDEAEETDDGEDEEETDLPLALRD